MLKQLLIYLLILISTEELIPRNGVMGNPMKAEFAVAALESSSSSDAVKEVTLEDRPTCFPVDINPPTRVDTTERVIKLREEMEKSNLTGYIIPSDDEHQSEYVAEADERRKYISGFSGSAGTAVVTLDQQALWTDGRYFLQAENELDCHWILMKEGEENVPTILEWLGNLSSGSLVGADSKLISASTWLSNAEALQPSGIEMVEVEPNLVDSIWDEDGRPPYVQDEIFVHDIIYAGKSWQDKVSEVREIMATEGAEMLILTALDEVAWLLNLRGSDIPYNPVFRSYVAVTTDEVNLFVPLNKTTEAVKQHLTSAAETVNIQDYTSFIDYLNTTTASKVMIPDAYSYAGGASYAVYSKIQEDARMLVTSPVLLKKAQKNSIEIQGMKNAHVKDAVALCDFLNFMEKEITSGQNWTEISAADKLAEYRAEQDGAMGLSFSTISGYGPNGAIIHYRPSNATDATISNTSLYLLDSGGQYLDGTTDVTRTLHYGEATPYMTETYTRVLMGHIDLASAVFPVGTVDTRVDILARQPLFEIGLDYNHGTGHGIGMFLGVHEAPTQVRIYGIEDHPFHVGYFFSDVHIQTNAWF